MAGNAETRLRLKLCEAAVKQGFWASNTNDKFVGGKPDFRISRKDTGQMDIELKILGVQPSTIKSNRVVNSGITPLQKIELREMNAAGAPAVGLIYIPEYEKMVFTNFETFSPGEALSHRWVEYVGGEKQVDFVSLLLNAWDYLKEHYPYDRHCTHP